MPTNADYFDEPFEIVPTAVEYHNIKITPALASRWLRLNTSNRKTKDAKIAAWSVDMKLGRWLETAEPIKFAGPPEDPEKLLDGQNRLYAIVKADVAVTNVVAFNVAEVTQDAMDSGTKRTVADQLSIAGMHNGNTVAAAAMIAMRVMKGRITGGVPAVSDLTLRKFIDNNLDLFDSAEFARRVARKTDMPPSIVCYTHWVLSKIDAEEAAQFWVDAADKVGLAAGDPVIALTNRMAEARRNAERTTLHNYLSAIYRAWNYRRSGRPLKMIKFSHDGSLIAIPEPK